jgi:asparagine synthase (glutamine-hydrolysing)
MCGIVGAYGWTDETRLASMLDCIEHRGPDGEGSYLDRDAEVMLGARRLSIVDLAGGSQPQWNEDETVGVVFNGEIYNHDTLRASLQRNGHRFDSRCDTEVLVHLWEEDGEGMVDSLDGMFAFAIWDRDAKTVFLARDRLGIKPLYLGETDEGYVWGSELPVLLSAGVDRRIDPTAVYNHFALEYTPGSQTLLADVRKVEPGHSIRIGPDGIDERTYWSLLDCDATDVTGSLDAAADRLFDLLERSVQKRLMADVPLGAFLSGGLDSSAVVGIASRLTDDPLKTYSITFDDDDLDESAHARLVADHFGTDHHEIDINLSSMELFGEMVRYLGEPTGHLQMLPIYALAGRASEDVKVALAGEGADELFAGYHWYQSVPQRKRSVTFLPDFVHDIADVAAPHTPVGSEHLRYLAGLKNDTEILLNHVCGFTTFRPDPGEFLRVSETAETSGLRTTVEEITTRVDEQTLEQYMSTFETRYTLPDYHLYKADHMSMAQSLEVRVPFLSTEIVEFAHGLPTRHKVTEGGVKRVLKRAVSDLLPDPILNREKLGMQAPVEEWFRADHAAIETWFTREKLAATPYINPEEVTALRDGHRRGSRSVGRTLWMILTYVAWYHTFVDEGSAIV